ncbi:ethanolamine ammonia-lyase reactivating factor EutA [Xylanimonas ulmi]|uniref:Reactivating factor of adenosylcobalamin-dependent ethanolamine ammonia lyase n=1 Tax=Xylanimonas ulmi TaxID=228973 RepID=A0A4Q7LZ63_9MICO|nr:ethanolamine ammonia-lyase reactivating factor EutA [Xylanibacterium ulmi]RZS60051.1 reactivating factor of adenosylcobalamin-dependent ethanolamine ammonia lyase [Xylanibacterium ulmi]
MAETRQVLSVGIDIGTTTSQFVVSRLTVSNQARGGLVPRLGVDDRAVLYQSQPHLTPLAAPDRVDVAGVLAMVHREYELAGIDASQVESGAVIVTGETARTRNAEAILNGLSDLAGEFVVTVAGPALEAQIAGRGSGACEWSSGHYATVVNVDIGGGSSNAAVFRSGKHIASAAAMVGGRQAMVDPDTGVLTHLKPAGAQLVEALGLDDLVVGRRVEVAALRRLTDAMADVVVDLVLGATTPLTELVALTPPLRVEEQVSACFVSGGVGHLYYADEPCETLAQVARFGDVGPLLARSLRESPRWATLRVERPQQTLRATVLGASNQQVTLSGSTIWTDAAYLPLRNLPVVEPRFGALLDGAVEPDDVRTAVAGAVRRWDLEAERGTFALVLDLPERMAYRQVVGLAEGLAAFAGDYLPPSRPLVLVTEADYAQVIGQTLKGRLPDLPLVVVDQIGLDEGDFIDIGEPLFDGRAVPVSVKTLVFYQ